LPLQSPFVELDQSKRVKTKLAPELLAEWRESEQKAIDNVVSNASVPFLQVYARRDAADSIFDAPTLLSPVDARSSQQLRIDLLEVCAWFLQCSAVRLIVVIV
jgi:hypothetical protein